MLFSKFDYALMRATCLKIMQENKYFPNANEIIGKYREIKRTVEIERLDMLKKQNRLLTKKQEYCYLCGNTGYCKCTIGGYEFNPRCTCSHGNDLNKFGYYHIHNDQIPEARDNYSPRTNEKIKNRINPFYIPTVKELLRDDYYIYEADKKNKHMEILSEEKKQTMLERTKSFFGGSD